MTREQLTEIFTKQINAKKEGSILHVPDATIATLLVAYPGETLAIARVQRVDAGSDLVTVDTSKGERYVLLVDDVRGVRIERASDGRRDRAGF